MNNPLIRRLATTAIALLLLLYVGYQVYRAHSPDSRTETAAYFTASDSVQVTGIAVRNEVLLDKKAAGGGVVDYVLSNGDKVSKGGVVALICENEQQAAARRELAGVDREIQSLQSLQTPGDTYAATPDSLNGQIHQKLSALLGRTVSGEYGLLSQSREELLYLLSERQIVTGGTADFSARLKTLAERKAALTEQAGSPAGRILSPASGYFVSETDGLESALDFSGVRSLTADEILAAERLKPTPVSGKAGKISGSYEWYFACAVEADRAGSFRRLASGGTVSVKFPFVSNVTVPASVAAVNQRNSNSPAAVILRSTYMNAAIASIRKQTAQVVVNEYTGIRVSRRALHFRTLSQKRKNADGKETTVKKEVSGVYVLHGNQIGFRQIVPLYSTEDYVVCDPNPKAEDLMTADTVKLHDEVVVEGTDLYDGKIVQ